MSNVSLILHKRSSVHGAKPSLSSLSAGELAINIADSKIFLKTIDDVIHTFSDEESAAFILNAALSGVVPHDGNNNISQWLLNFWFGRGGRLDRQCWKQIDHQPITILGNWVQQKASRFNRLR